MNSVYLLEKNLGSVNFVFVHGWGSDNNLWAELRSCLLEKIPSSHYAVNLPGFGLAAATKKICLDDYLNQIGKTLPSNTILIGWSLGGLIASQLAARNPSKVKALITLACNPCFTCRDDWPWAMPVSTFEGFKKNFATAPLRTWHRFCALQSQGGQTSKVIVQTLKQQCPPTDATMDAWLQGLDWLHQIDNRQALSSLSIPNLHLLGGGDSLVPSSVASEVLKLGFSEVECIANSGHCVHLSQTQKTASNITSWLTRKELIDDYEVIDKKKIAHSFGVAATSYDSAAELQWQVAAQLIDFAVEALDGFDLSSERVLDLGCGTGYVSEILLKHPEIKPPNCLALLDLAEPMVRLSREKILALMGETSVKTVCADAESLPFSSASFDAVISSLALQWCSHLTILSHEIVRVLKKGGYFLFSTLGPNTLIELKSSWAAVNGFVHVNHFDSLQDIKTALSESGLKIEQVINFKKVMQYSRLLCILRDLKAIGAHNMNDGQNPGLTSVKQLRRLEKEYEKYRDEEGFLPVTYDVILIIAKKV